MATATGKEQSPRAESFAYGANEDDPEVNVGSSERMVSVLAGGGLALAGLARGSLFGLGVAAVGGGLLYRGLTGRCQAYAAMGVNTAQPRRQQVGVPGQRGIKIETALHIHRPAEEVFEFWRNLNNLPRFMSHLISVTPGENQRSTWVAKGPLGATLHWEAETINERPSEVIAWRSLPGADVDTAGSVHFIPVHQGTDVRIELKYDPPGGKIGASIAELLGVGAEQRIREDVRHLKQILEAGEIPTIKGQPRGHC